MVRVARGPKENRHRPAIDPLFRSAASHHGPRVVGVLLSGGLNDGVAGLWAIRSCGGTTVVQDPSDARFPSMLRSALESFDVDHRLRAAEIAALIERLVREPSRDRDGNETLEEALYSALRALEESAELSRRLAHRARDRANVNWAQSMERKAQSTERKADVLRKVLYAESESDGGNIGTPKRER